MNKSPRMQCENSESLRIVLCNWLMKNIKLPTDTSSLIAFVILMFIAWFILNAILKFILSILYPILIVGAALLVYPFARDGNMGTLIFQFNDLGRDVIIKLIQIVSQGFRALTNVIY